MPKSLLSTCLFVGVLCALSVGDLSQPAAATDKKTERLWKAKCSSCHGLDGKGATTQGKKMAVQDLTTAEWQKRFTDAQMIDVTNKGLKRDKNGVKQEMDAYSALLKPGDAEALVAFMRSLAAR
jgi:cytochrome c